MSDTEHTPGPLKTDRNDSCMITARDEDGNVFAVAEAVRPHEGLLKGDPKANAQLFAAAPDLLEAAKNFFSGEHDYGHSAHQNILVALEDDDLSHKIVKDLFEQLREAIDKAEATH